MDYGMDVLPDMFGLVPAQTQCEYCGKVILLTNAIRSQYLVAGEVRGEEHYCSKPCADGAWVQRTGVDV